MLVMSSQSGIRDAGRDREQLSGNNMQIQGVKLNGGSVYELEMKSKLA